MRTVDQILSTKFSISRDRLTENLRKIELVALIEMRAAASEDIPFFSGRDAAHTVQPVQDRLQARKNGPICLHRERSFQPWFMLGLLQEAFQFDQFDLQVQLPEFSIIISDRVRVRIAYHSHCHECLDGAAKRRASRLRQ